MFTLTWITEKELARVTENKRDEFFWKKNTKIQSGGETMTNASGQQGENEGQWKIKAKLNTGSCSVINSKRDVIIYLPYYYFYWYLGLLKLVIEPVAVLLEDQRSSLGIPALSCQLSE